MSLRIQIEDERGKLVTEVDGKVVQQVGDLHNVISKLASRSGSTRLFRYVDPYADTTFNQWQADDLLRDIALLLEIATPEQSELLREIEGLVRTYSSRAHLYLKFYGD